MQIREGAYYRTRGGDVVGPMKPVTVANDAPHPRYVWGCFGRTWTDSGDYDFGAGYLEEDLISEVYVSDTPPAVKETEEELREMMRDPRYWQKREPEWVKRVTDGFRALVGGGEPPATGPNGAWFEVHDRKTLRDEFAMEAMKILIPRQEQKDETFAELAYIQADAMMEARKK
jgi:hypothetical protein